MTTNPMSEAERLALALHSNDPHGLLSQAATELRRLQAKVDELLRWKGIHAPRIEALEGLLAMAQIEAALGVEAIATLASERQANAILTNEIEALQKWRDEADILATYSRSDGHREWVTVGTWLRPGEVVAHMDARTTVKGD